MKLNRGKWSPTSRVRRNWAKVLLTKTQKLSRSPQSNTEPFLKWDPSTRELSVQIEPLTAIVAPTLHLGIRYRRVGSLRRRTKLSKRRRVGMMKLDRSTKKARPTKKMLNLFQKVTDCRAVRTNIQDRSQCNPSQLRTLNRPLTCQVSTLIIKMCSGEPFTDQHIRNMTGRTLLLQMASSEMEVIREIRGNLQMFLISKRLISRMTRWLELIK